MQLFQVFRSTLGLFHRSIGNPPLLSYTRKGFPIELSIAAQLRLRYSITWAIIPTLSRPGRS